ncbi:hypothetical protein HOLleu_17238 [Holothuria leucospilota]|uniref:Uncharacterized protein n=1 Tax=Holothuria leucospilota TaxID=206669 RepID=A0A9Q1C6F0_HOLLE|nr:hypothetical protein HOLleu_17238 [Holothuria leucospilota]
MRCVIHTSAGEDVFSDAFRAKFLRKLEEWFAVDHDIALWVRPELRLFRNLSSSPCGYVEVFGFDKVKDPSYTRVLTKNITAFVTNETGIPAERFFVLFRQVWETNFALPGGDLLCEQ